MEQVHRALQQGLLKAQELQSAGLLWCALLACQGRFVATPWQQTMAGPVRPDEWVAETEVGSVFA